MPDLKDFFSDLLGTIEGEQERQAILSTLTKTDKGKEMLNRLNALATDGENYRTWHNNEVNGWPVYKKAHETLSSVQKQLDETLKENEELKAGKGAAAAADPQTPAATEEFDMEAMTQEQLNKLMDDRIKAMGFISRADAESIADIKAREAAAGLQMKVYKHALPLLQSKIELTRQFEADFPGKKWDRERDNAFDKFVGENKFPSMLDAYAAFTRTDYEAKTKADAFAQGQIEGAKVERERLEKQYAEQAARSLPVDMGGGIGIPIAPGALAPEPVDLEKINSDTDFDISRDVRSGGVGQLARAIAQKVKADRASGKTMGA